ncbi:MAG: hypothetical protein R3C49_08265 [Planctomycetaceae bacterium]
MKTVQRRFLYSCSRLFVAAALVTVGCEHVESVVDDVKSTVSEQMQSEPAAPVAVTPAPAPAPPTPAAPPQPTAQQLLAEFQALRPDQVNDAALARVTSLPEAASAVTEVVITSIEITRNGLACLASMENLKRLSLRCPLIPSSDLNVIAEARSLSSLDLAATKTTDEVVGNLTSLSSLESLSLAGTPVTHAVGAPLTRFTELKSLDLTNTLADDATVAAVASLPLRELKLARTRITNATIDTVRKIKTLENLDVASCQVTGNAFKGISSTGIKRLVIADTPFGIEGYAALKGMRNLEELHGTKSQLMEHKAANVFRTMPNLRILDLGNNALTNAGMEVYFKGHRTLEELYLGENRGISDLGLASLIGIKTLRFLDVHHTGCTASGAQALKEKLPDCRIQTSEGAF